MSKEWRLAIRVATGSTLSARTTQLPLRAAAVALALLGTSGTLHLVGADDRVRLAQTAERHVDVAATILAEPATQIPFAIQVGPQDAVPANSFIRLRGLPHSVSLSEGHAIAPGAWAIPLFGLATLQANIPAGLSGRSELIVTLVAVDGTVLAEGTSALLIESVAEPAPSENPLDPKHAGALIPPIPVPADRPDRNSAPKPPELAADEIARAEKLLALGERYLAQGNIAGARQFFQRAANAGLAQGALRLAGTYDPAELERLQVRGVAPDRAEARKWYERAKELGAPEAEERLARLGGS